MIKLKVRWGKMFNPVDWAVWIYGKFFEGHQIIGFICISFLVLIAVALIWFRGVDKYNEELALKTKTPPISKIPEATTPPDQKDKHIKIDGTKQYPPDLSKAKRTVIITSADQFVLKEGAKIKDISDKIVPGCFELSADPTPSAPPGLYSRVAVMTKVDFSTHYYASVRLDAKQDVQAMDIIGRDIWVGISPDWAASYIWETEQLQNTWAVKNITRLTINTLAVYQQGKDIFVYINNGSKPIATYTKKSAPQPGPVGIQLKANQLRGGKMVFRDFSVWDYEM
jgi:hypothetical protein